MTRICECGCGAEFTPRKSTGRFASTACRVRWNRAQKRQESDAGLLADAKIVALAGRRRTPQKPTAAVASVEAAVRAELGDVVNTSLGQQALLLAQRMDQRVDTSGSAVAALSKQLVILTAAAMGGAEPDAAADPVAAVQAQVLSIRQAHAG